MLANELESYRPITTKHNDNVAPGIETSPYSCAIVCTVVIGNQAVTSALCGRIFRYADAYM